MNRWQSIRLQCLVLGLLLPWPELTFAQTEAAATHYREGIALIGQGRLREAEPILNNAVKQGRLELAPNSAEFQRWLNSLGNLYLNMGRADQAQPILDEAIAIARSSDAATRRPETVLSVSYLATLNADIGNNLKAELLARQAIQLAEANLGPTDPRLAQPLSGLGIIYSYQARCTEARPLMERALRLIEGGEGVDRIEQGKRHTAMIIHLLECRITRPSARAEMEAQLTQVEKYLPNEHPTLAWALYGMGQIYYKERRLDPAEASLLRAKAVAEKSLGSGGWLTNRIRRQLHDVYFERALTAVRMASVGGRLSAGDQSCTPIQTAINKLNATKRFQLSTQYINDGWGNHGLEEQIISEWKSYKRWNKGPWSVVRRKPQPFWITGKPTVSKCQSIGEETVGGTTTKLFLYERYRPQSRMRALMWVSKDTGLPVQTLLRAIEPDNSEEMINTFSYDQNIGEPIFETKL